MERWATIVGLLLGAVVGGYGFYLGQLDGAAPLRDGESALMRRDYAEAIGAFHRVIDELRRSAKVPVFGVGLTLEKQQHRYAALKGLAQAHLQSGDPLQARVYLEQASAINPLDPLLSLLAAEIHAANGDLADADSALTRLIETNPRSYHNYLLRARLRGHQGDCRGQIEDYGAALQRLDAPPRQHERIATVRELAWLLATHARPACRDAGRALTLLAGVAATVEAQYTEPARGQFLAAQAAALARHGDFGAARTTAQEAAALLPRDSADYTAIQRQLSAYGIDQPWTAP